MVAPAAGQSPYLVSLPQGRDLIVTSSAQFLEVFFFHIFYLQNMMLYQNGKILYFNKTSYLKYLQCLLIVLKYDHKFNFVQEIKLQYIQKKKWQASTTTHDLLLTTSKFDLLSYIGEKCLATHLQSFLCVS